MRLEKELLCDGIIIRNYSVDDKDFCTGMWFDPENGKYLSDPTREYVDEVYRNAIDNMEDSKDGYYLVIERKADGKKIGTCCAFPNEDMTNIDIGYCIDKIFWRNGYASEAVRSIIDWTKDNSIKTITAEVAKENLSSCRLLKKLGFKEKEETSFKKYHMDKEYDSYIYELVN